MITPDKHAVISGGGLAGSLLALVLANRGMRVTVFEKRGDLRSLKAPSGKSINLALSERGIHALSKVDLADQVLKGTIPMRGRMVHARDGTTSFLPYSQKDSEYIRSVSRPGLNRILLEKAGLHPNIELHFNSEVLSIEPDKKVVSLNSGHSFGREVSYDLLFGTDGAGSLVRSSLHAFSDIGYRQEMLGHGYKELSMPALADGSFVLEPEALHIWPRGTYMLIALPNLDHTFTCTLFLPFDDDPGFNQLKEESQISAFFDSQFQDAVPLIPSLLTDFMTNPTGRLGTVRCDKWTYGDTALILGDAAHAIVPFFGQGMNCAFEDVSVLAEMLDAETHESWSELLHDFEKERIVNTNAIADMALTNYIEMRDLVADPAFRLRRSVALELEKRFPERFIPKYSLVSFHRVPYKQAQEIGQKQEFILKTVCEGKRGIAEIDWELAEMLVAELGAVNWAR